MGNACKAPRDGEKDEVGGDSEPSPRPHHTEPTPAPPAATPAPATVAPSPTTPPASRKESSSRPAETATATATATAAAATAVPVPAPGPTPTPAAPAPSSGPTESPVAATVATPATPPPAPNTTLVAVAPAPVAVPVAVPVAAARPPVSSSGSASSAGSKPSASKRAKLPTLDLKRARPVLAGPGGRAGAGSGGDARGAMTARTGALTARLNEVDADGLLVTEQHRKEAKLMKFSKECSEITPWMFVSGEKVAQDLPLLQSKGITAVVNAAGITCPSPFEDKGLSYLTLCLYDTPREEIVPFFYQVVQIVETERARGGKVLIHCHQGVSRSGTLAIAYVMWAYGLSYDDGHDFVRSRRGTVSPNPGFLCQLMEWGSELAAIGFHGSPCCSLAYVQDSGVTPTASGPRSRASSCTDTATANAALMYEVLPLTTAGWMSSGLAKAMGLPAPDGQAHVPVTHVLQLARRKDDRRVTPPVLASMDDKQVYVVRVPLKPSSSSTPASDSDASKPAVDAAFVRVGASVPPDAVDAVVNAASAEARRWYTFRPARPVTPMKRVDATPLLNWGHIDDSVVLGSVSPSVPDPRIIRAGVNDGLLAAMLSTLGGATSHAVSSESTADAVEDVPTVGDLPPALKRSGAVDVGGGGGGGGAGSGAAAAGSADDEQEDGDGEDAGKSSRPTLYKWSGPSTPDVWETLGVYDDDDLDEDSLLVLLPSKADTASSGYVWSGSGFSGLEGDALKAAVTAFVASLPGPPTPPQDFVSEGSEPESFWELFECGY